MVKYRVYFFPKSLKFGSCKRANRVMMGVDFKLHKNVKRKKAFTITG